MTTSENLRKEMIQSAPFTKRELIDTICRGIKANGRAMFICDKHIRETDVRNCGGTIRMADEQAAIEFAHSEGFEWHYDYNSYGVRYIVFTL